MCFRRGVILGGMGRRFLGRFRMLSEYRSSQARFVCCKQ
jgi:hypothetical protein